MSQSTLSLFCGIGGWEAGLGAEDVVAAIDSDRAACESWQANWGDRVIHSPVSEIDYRQYEGIDRVTASPPCQEYSLAKRTGFVNRDRRDAGLVLVKVLRDARPNTLLIENVPQYVKSPVFQEICQTARQLEYFVNHAIADAADYGIPQNRKRMFCVISRQPYAFPLVFCQPANWYDAIADLLLRMPEVRLSDRDWQKYGTWLQKNKIGLLDHDGAGSSAVPRCKNFPAKTVRAMGGDRHCWQFTAAANGRFYRLSPRAIARLQSFPDSLILPEDWVEACKRIGNAVPPLLIHKLFGDFVRESNLAGNGLQKLNSIQNPPTQNSKFQPVEV
ncbi:MAG: DNA cytosine methyltransferase [Spirulina sp.]